MKFINRPLFSVILSLTAMHASAQESGTLFAADSTKFFEGRLLIKNRNATVSPNSYLSGDGMRQRELSDNWKSNLTPFLPENLFGHVLLDGRCRLFYKNSKEYVSQEYKLGVASGKYEEHYTDGDLMIKGQYKSGAMDGDWKYFFKNGKTAFEGTFFAPSQKVLLEKLSRKYNSRISDVESSFSEERYQFAHTAIAAFRMYDRQLLKLGTGLNGTYIFYYYDGQKCALLSYKNGIAHGTWTTWDRNGKLTNKAEFKDGLAIAILKDGILTTYEEYEQKKKTEIRTYYDEPNGIDPGIVEEAPQQSQDTNSVFRYVEQMPEPPFNLQDWIAKNLVYPADAIKNEEQGRVIVQFTVKKDGTISDVKVVRGMSSSCNKAAVNLIKKMPAWKPGKQNGKPVDVYFTLPVTFKLL